MLEKYYNQLYMYVHILNERYGVFPERMYINETAEPDRGSVLMQIPIDEYEIQKAKKYFDLVRNSIQNKDFAVKETSAKLCQAVLQVCLPKNHSYGIIFHHHRINGLNISNVSLK